MRTSEEIDELATALAASQAKFPKITKSKTADVPMKNGGKYSYSYADLSDVIDAIRPVLATNGIAIIQAIDLDDDTGKVQLLTRLLHSSGQWLEAHYPLPGGGSPQEMGSAVTYARRYSLTSLAGIAAEDDDDGRQAGQVKGEQKRSNQQRTQEPAKPKAQEQAKPERPLQALGNYDRNRTVEAIIAKAPDHPKVKDKTVSAMGPKALEALAKAVGVDLAAPEAPKPEGGEPAAPAGGTAPDWSDHWSELASKNALWPAELEATLQGTPEGKDLTLATLDPESEAGRKLAAALKAKGAA